MQQSIVAIVPAFNAGRYIGPCIEGLRATGFAPDEIVIADDGSRDDTVDVARRLGVTPLELSRNRGASHARNAAVRAAGGDLLFFVDADVVLAPDARQVALDFFAGHPDHAAIFGAYDDAPAAPGRVSRIRNLLHRHVHVEGAGAAVTFWTGCGVLRRSDFEAVGGFDEDQPMMEDVELGLRLTAAGRAIRLDPALQGTHLKRWTLPGMIRTDLFHRAIPWARLLMSGQGGQAVLNVGAVGKVSVLAVLGSLLAVALAAAAPLAGLLALLAALAALALANARFLRMLWRDHAPADAIAALGVLWVHYLCGGLGYAWVLMERVTGAPTGRRRPESQATKT
ncbi:MAG: glycosyltransferase [Pseudomonadota bacterium]